MGLQKRSKSKRKQHVDYEEDENASSSDRDSESDATSDEDRKTRSSRKASTPSRWAWIFNYFWLFSFVFTMMVVSTYDFLSHFSEEWNSPANGLLLRKAEHVIGSKGCATFTNGYTPDECALYAAWAGGRWWVTNIAALAWGKYTAHWVSFYSWAEYLGSFATSWYTWCVNGSICRQGFNALYLSITGNLVLLFIISAWVFTAFVMLQRSVMQFQAIKVKTESMVKAGGKKLRRTVKTITEGSSKVSPTTTPSSSFVLQQQQRSRTVSTTTALPPIELYEPGGSTTRQTQLEGQSSSLYTPLGHKLANRELLHNLTMLVHQMRKQEGVVGMEESSSVRYGEQESL